MAVTTTKTNKPINPRGNDQSPKGYNRAELYTGKALDFDGTNDSVDLDGFTMTGTTATFAFNVNFDAITINQFVFDLKPVRFVIGLSDITGNPFGLYDNSQWQSFGDLEPNQWHNVSISIDGTSAKMYLNGQSFGNEMTMANAIDFDSATEVSVGSNFSGGGGLLNGQIAGFKIFNTALTAAQVSDLYNNPEKIVPTGVADTALKLWLPMMEGAGTTCINGAPDALGDELFTQPIDLTAEFTTNAGGVIVDADTFTSAGGSFDGIRANNILTTGKVYVLQIEGSTTSSGFTIGNVNASGNEYGTGFGIHYFKAQHPTLWIRQTTAGTTDLTTLTLKELKDVGTISGATWTHGVGAPVAQTAVVDWNKHPFNVSTDILIPQGLTAGRDIGGSLFKNVRKQGALNLDGNSWAEVHDNASFDITSEVSVECWFYNVSGANATGLVGRWENTNANKTYFLFKSDDDDIRFYVRKSGTETNVTSGAAVSTDAWHHVVGTYNGSNVKIYIDGSESASVSFTGDLQTASIPLTIGRWDNNLNYAYPDQIAQPRIYNRALTAEEVQRNYDAGKNIYK